MLCLPQCGEGVILSDFRVFICICKFQCIAHVCYIVMYIVRDIVYIVSAYSVHSYIIVRECLDFFTSELESS